MTKIEQKITKLLADYPEREFYAQEIAEKLKFSKASASGLLKSLSEEGIIFKKVKGHMKFYQINQKSPEVKKFRINSALEEVSLLLPKLKKYSQKIILFGSASRGEQTYGSDIDLFILTDDREGARVAIKKADKSLLIRPVIKSPGEWSEMEIKEPEFYQEVKNGIILYEYVPRI